MMKKPFTRALRLGPENARGGEVLGSPAKRGAFSSTLCSRTRAQKEKKEEEKRKTAVYFVAVYVRV